MSKKSAATKHAALKRPSLAQGVRCPVCDAAPGVRCAEQIVRYKTVEKKINGAIERSQVPVYGGVHERCRKDRRAKAVAARDSELAQQRRKAKREDDLGEAFGL